MTAISYLFESSVVDDDNDIGFNIISLPRGSGQVVDQPGTRQALEEVLPSLRWLDGEVQSPDFVRSALAALLQARHRPEGPEEIDFRRELQIDVRTVEGLEFLGQRVTLSPAGEAVVAATLNESVVVIRENPIRMAFAAAAAAAAGAGLASVASGPVLVLLTFGAVLLITAAVEPEVIDGVTDRLGRTWRMVHNKLAKPSS